MSKSRKKRREKTSVYCVAKRFLAFALLFGCGAASYAVDRTISEDHRLSADEVVDGILTVASGATVDLNGHNLTVKGLAGNGTITVGIADLTAPDPNEERVSYTTGSDDLYADTKAINLFNDNYVRGVDSTNRVIIASTNLPLAVTYDFGVDSPKRVDMYKLYIGPLGGNLYKRGPKAWTFEGSNDNAAWTSLDSQDSVTWPTTQETRTYTFENPSSYRYYRFTFLASNSGSWMEAVQLEYFSSADGLSAPSELHVSVPSNASTTNSTVAISGNVRLVKEGAGEFVAARADQMYSGGNQVNAGKLKAVPGERQLFGVDGTDVTVEAGATFDVNGSSFCSIYHYKMNGGTAANSEALSSDQWHLGDMTLTADSFIDSTYALGFRKTSSLPLCIDLGGHVLAVTNGGGFRLMNATVSNGTLRVSNADDQNRTVYFNSGVTYANTATFDLQGLVGAYYDVEVSNLLFRAGNQTHVKDSATGTYKIYGTFKTETTDFPFVKMMDGSTLDLTAQQEPFDTASTSANANGLKLTFDAEATVTINVSGRVFALGDCIVAWSDRPNDVTFLFDTTTAAGGVAPVATARGLFYGYVTNAVEYAWWTGAANDGDLTNPANWRCQNAVGGAVDGGLPSGETRVYLEGSLSIQVPSGGSLACGICILSNCTLAADCDLRGFGTKLLAAEGAEINLNGHRLYIPSTALTGNCTVKDRAVGHDDDLTTNDPSRVSSPTTCYVDGMTAANLFNNNYVRSKSGNSGRIIVAEAQLPLIATYDFGAAQVVDAYRMWTGPDYSRRLPRIWKFEGSNDNARWTLLDVRHAEAKWTDDNRHRTYTFTNTTAYRYYRITFTAAQTNSGGYLELVQLEFFLLKPTQGELHIDTTFGSNERLELHGLGMSGNMRLFLEGSGAVRLTKTGQTYVGGTEICGGMLLPGNGGASILHADLLGEEGSEVLLHGDGSGTTSAASALVDFGNRFGYTGYKYVLAGGTIQNPQDSLTEIRLDADSWVKTMTGLTRGDTAWIGSTGAVCTGYADLGGHELSVAMASGKKFGLSNATLENGSLSISGRGWFMTTNSVVATNNVLVKVDCRPDIGGSFAVRDYTQTDTDKDYNMGDHDIDVFGTFKIGSTGVFHGSTLHDGSTIDLSNLSEPLNVAAPFNASSATAQGVRTLHFEPDAKVGVKLGGRNVPGNTRIIVWTAADKPAGTVKFTCADDGARRSFVVKDDGLYVLPSGSLMLFR